MHIPSKKVFSFAVQYLVLGVCYGVGVFLRNWRWIEPLTDQDVIFASSLQCFIGIMLTLICRVGIYFWSLLPTKMSEEYRAVEANKSSENDASGSSSRPQILLVHGIGVLVWGVFLHTSYKRVDANYAFGLGYASGLVLDVISAPHTSICWQGTKTLLGILLLAHFMALLMLYWLDDVPDAWKVASCTFSASLGVCCSIFSTQKNKKELVNESMPTVVLLCCIVIIVLYHHVTNFDFVITHGWIRIQSLLQLSIEPVLKLFACNVLLYAENEPDMRLGVSAILGTLAAIEYCRLHMSVLHDRFFQLYACLVLVFNVVQLCL